MLKSYSTTMVLRVRMPISDDLAPRNFITKIVRYDRVVNVPNSMTVLEEMMPASVAMAEAKLCGIYNFCNPGAVSHNEILDMYKEIVDPTFVYENFTIEEQNKILEGQWLGLGLVGLSSCAAAVARAGPHRRYPAFSFSLTHPTPPMTNPRPPPSQAVEQRAGCNEADGGAGGLRGAYQRDSRGVPPVHHSHA